MHHCAPAAQVIERGYVPDFLLRRGIRLLLGMRLRELQMPNGEMQQRRLMARTPTRRPPMFLSSRRRIGVSLFTHPAAPLSSPDGNELFPLTAGVCGRPQTPPRGGADGGSE